MLILQIASVSPNILVEYRQLFFPIILTLQFSIGCLSQSIASYSTLLFFQVFTPSLYYLVVTLLSQWLLRFSFYNVLLCRCSIFTVSPSILLNFHYKDKIFETVQFCLGKMIPTFVPKAAPFFLCYLFWTMWFCP